MPYPENYRVRTWKSPTMLHWILNPGLVINELILGQRVPKVILMDNDKTKSLLQRIKIPCLHCDTLHSGAKWSEPSETRFNNWFGIYCDHCGQIIPCLRNFTSLIILGITLPIWYWFKAHWKAS